MLNDIKIFAAATPNSSSFNPIATSAPFLTLPSSEAITGIPIFLASLIIEAMPLTTR
nr:hypothetical protein [Candidatus Aquarickettsia rohweri]